MNGEKKGMSERELLCVSVDLLSDGLVDVKMEGV